MRHLDLFSGIGGFALAADAVWPDVKHTFVEIDPFCRAVLKKHWPNATFYGDIRTLTNAKSGGCGFRTSKDKRSSTVEVNTSGDKTGLWEHGTIEILTGGFPCQPFSQAGRRKGTADDRYLWPEMFAVIKYTLPRWVIAENVRGLVTWNDGMVLEKCCTDLESIGYEVQPVVVPACAVGAPHRRDRVWIVACNTEHDGLNGSQDRKGGEAGKRSDTERTDELCEPAGSVMAWKAATDTERKGKGRRGELKAKRQRGKRGGAERGEGYDWSEDWPTVAARLCRLDDGVPSGLPRPRGWRNAALKAYGNAIVPAVAIKIMEAIKTADKKAPQPEGENG